MDAFSNIPLSASGRPVFLEDEVELRTFGDVRILKNDKSPIFPDKAVMMLTNLRIIVLFGKEGGAYGFLLTDVKSFEDCARNLFASSTRVRCCFASTLLPEIGFGFERAGPIKTSSTSKEDFLTSAQHALEKRRLFNVATKSSNADSASSSSSSIGGGGSSVLLSTSEETEDAIMFSSRNTGVGGLIRKQERDLQAADELVGQATTDLKALMQRAKEVVQIVKKYSAYTEERTMARGGGGSGGSSSDAGDSVMSDNEMENILLSIGMVSPVTKHSAGRLFHQQLARQLADLLSSEDRLQRVGGMITLTDLYCLCNLTRGTELISPDDLLQSAKLMEQLQLNMRLRRLDSGVLMIQSTSLDEETLCQQLVDLSLQDASFRQEGILATDLAHRMCISIFVANEQLLLAEKRGVLCRDDSVRGIAFFPNRFL